MQGATSPGRDAKERNTTFACFEQKSSVAKKLRFRVLSFTVSTTGAFHKSFQNAQVPPAVDANSTTPLYFPCSFVWCSTTNCKSLTSSRTIPSWKFLDKPIGRHCTLKAPTPCLSKVGAPLLSSTLQLQKWAAPLRTIGLVSPSSCRKRASLLGSGSEFPPSAPAAS